jgi:2-polyprenyl-3-methyl-5-hydroxy-6-metoxy-1,4-benzoquinol methylase
VSTPAPSPAATSFSCGLCGTHRFSRLLSTKDFFGRPAHLGLCLVCGLIQAEERPGNDVLEEYYSRYCYDDEDAWRIPAPTNDSLRRVAQALSGYRKNNRCLEVGCGTGSALKIMAEAGWKAEGTELSTVAARKLEAEGFRIHVGAIEEVCLPAAQYDVVILSEVIEHLRDPKAALARIQTALRPGGAAYITTPNFEALSRRLLGARWRIIAVPEHLFYFTTRSLGSMLTAVGLLPVRIVSEGMNPFELWAGLRRGRNEAALHQAKVGGESIRAAVKRRWSVWALKAVVNSALRFARLGDTLKALAERPCVPG